MAMNITDGNFEEVTTAKSDKLTVIDFWAEWCGPCKMIGPIVEELATEYKETVNIGKMDVDANSEVPFKFGVRSIPTIVFIKNGKEVDRHVGATTKAVLDAKIKANM